MVVVTFAVSVVLISEWVDSRSFMAANKTLFDGGKQVAMTESHSPVKHESIL